MARKTLEVGPKTRSDEAPQDNAQEKKMPARRFRMDWVKFKAKGRCYIEGVYLEDAGQEITMSPRAAFQNRKNKNIERIEGEIAQLPDDAPNDKEARAEYETAFIDDLEDGDPKVGPAPGGLKLIKQG